VLSHADFIDYCAFCSDICTGVRVPTRQVYSVLILMAETYLLLLRLSLNSQLGWLLV